MAPFRPRADLRRSLRHAGYVADLSRRSVGLRRRRHIDGFTEAAHDDASFPAAARRSSAGLLGHHDGTRRSRPRLPYLIPHFWTATMTAAAIVFFELWAIAFIQNRYMETPFLRAPSRWCSWRPGSCRRHRHRECLDFSWKCSGVVLVTASSSRVCGAGMSSFSPRTWSGWIPVTSTGRRDFGDGTRYFNARFGDPSGISPTRIKKGRGCAFLNRTVRRDQFRRNRRALPRHCRW